MRTCMRTRSTVALVSTCERVNQWTCEHVWERVRQWLGVHVWTCESVTMWTCKSVNVWIYEYLNVWICEHVNLWTCEVVNIWTCKSVNTWSCESVNMWTRESVNVWTCESVSMWTCVFVNMWTRETSERMNTRTRSTVVWCARACERLCWYFCRVVRSSVGIRPRRGCCEMDGVHLKICWFVCFFDCLISWLHALWTALSEMLNQIASRCSATASDGFAASLICCSWVADGAFAHATVQLLLPRCCCCVSFCPAATPWCCPLLMLLLLLLLLLLPPAAAHAAAHPAAAPAPAAGACCLLLLLPLLLLPLLSLPLPCCRQTTLLVRFNYYWSEVLNWKLSDSDRALRRVQSYILRTTYTSWFVFLRSNESRIMSQECIAHGMKYLIWVYNILIFICY